MEMLRILTQRLKNQKITDAPGNEKSKRQTRASRDTASSSVGHAERDSGTESDSSDAELDDLIKGAKCDTAASWNEDSLSEGFLEVSQTFKTLDDSSCGGRDSANGASDWRHSSEEELSTLCRTNTPEKRKWSQVKPNSSPSHSSDEEVCSLTTSGGRLPYCFRSTPPAAVVCPKPEAASKNAACKPVLSMKRKRHKVSPGRSCALDDGTGPRPHLNLEKMQQKAKKQCQSIGRARVVKVKSVRGDSRSPRNLCDPAVFAFRAIPVSPCLLSPQRSPAIPASAFQLTPIEEPCL